MVLSLIVLTSDHQMQDTVIAVGTLISLNDYAVSLLIAVVMIFACLLFGIFICCVRCCGIRIVVPHTITGLSEQQLAMLVSQSYKDLHLTTATSDQEKSAAEPTATATATATAESTPDLEKQTEIKSDLRACSICLAEYDASSMVILLPCQHLYHAQCIQTWLKLRKTCPTCREVVIPIPRGTYGAPTIQPTQPTPQPQPQLQLEIPITATTAIAVEFAAFPRSVSGEQK